jgi:hypothetical protein
LKLKRQHGDVLETKTLKTNEHGHQSAKFSATGRHPICTAPIFSIKASGTDSCHRSIMSQLSTPHDQMIKRSHSPAVGIATAGSNPQPNTWLHLHRKRKVMYMHSLLIPKFPSHKKVFFFSSHRTPRSSHRIHRPLHPQTSCSNFLPGPGETSLNPFGPYEKVQRDHRRLLRGDDKLLYSKRMVPTFVLDYARPQSFKVHFNCNETFGPHMHLEGDLYSAHLSS